ncbi:MAG: prolyl oligopeptidase family serine peptidase [Planctomycetota bacterium]|jgi:prolyl oligopeptidase
MRKINFFKIIILSISLLPFFGCGRFVSKDTATGLPSYPKAKGKSAVDVYHGKRIRDHYRWLENTYSTQTRTWVKAQNKLTSEFLAAFPTRNQTRIRLTDLINHPSYSVPCNYGGKYFLWVNKGLDNQYILYAKNSLNDPASIVINPNELSADGTVAVTHTAISRDGKFLAYALSRSGSYWQEVRIRSVETGEDYTEVLGDCYAYVTQIAWKNDGSGFYYNRYRAPATSPRRKISGYYHIFWHELGTPQSEDELVFEDYLKGFVPFVSQDGKYVILSASPWVIKNRVYFRPIDSNEPFIKLLDKSDAQYIYIGNVDSVFYFRTDLDAARGRIIAINTSNPSPDNWWTIISESEDIIGTAFLANNSLVVVSSHDVCDQLKIYSLDGVFVREIPLPAHGTVSDIWGWQDETEMFFNFTSFLYPTTNYRYDFSTGRLSILQEIEIDFDLSKYETKQVFFQSKDGTKVPMFITHAKDLPLDGNNPTLLYGYGGFNNKLTPYFSTCALSWLEKGGVYAVANIRGGGEYGHKWHEAGMLENKQNVFDDFIGAARWLIQNKFTRPEKLGIRGHSNGGLLVAACMVQQPELFGAVVCQVPVLDMLRFHKIHSSGGWVEEFGSAENDRASFRILYAYSPLHNVKRRGVYPPILVTTADHDDSVSPAHAYKFVATLQNRAARKNPVLLRVETKAGHGVGKPISKTIEEETDIYTFLFKILQVR